MEVRPDDAANFGRVIAMVFEDIEDVLLDFDLEAAVFGSINDRFGSILPVPMSGCSASVSVFGIPVFPDSQIEEQSVVFALSRWVVVLDQEAIARCLNHIVAWNMRLHEVLDRDVANMACCIDDRYVNRML